MEYGKFNSAEALLKGYNELEKSFTQKCQQLAALQKQNDAIPNSEKSKNADSVQDSAICHSERNDEVVQSKNLGADEMTQQSSGTSEVSPPQVTPPAEDKDAAMEVQAVCAVPADVDEPSAANDSPNPQPTAIEQIKQYLDAHPDARAELLDEPKAVTVTPLPKVMASGGNVPLVLPTKPKTIKEASILAAELFK